MNNAATTYKLPCNLSFDGKGGFKPGRGQAGWTVYAFESAADRAAFMAAYSEARMPCWARIESGEVV